MHSRIIALGLNEKIDHIHEDDMYEMMQGTADYVVEAEPDEEWGYEILRRIGTVDLEQMTFKADPVLVKQRLEDLWAAYQENIITSFDGFVDWLQVYRAKETLDDKFGVHIYSDWAGYPETWHEFLRGLWGNQELMDATWHISAIYDYHF